MQNYADGGGRAGLRVYPQLMSLKIQTRKEVIRYKGQQDWQGHATMERVSGP